MKTDTLKLKAIVIALLLAGSTQPLLQAAAPAQTMEVQTENEFIESMFAKIKDSVNAIIDLVESFIDKNNKESFSSFIGRCKDRLTLITNTILTPLQKELDRVKATRSGSRYHQILENTYRLANEMAYKELLTLHTILETHKKSPDAKKATALVGVLKPHLNKLTSVETLDRLDKKLAEIHDLLVAEKNTSVAKEIENLQKMVKEIRAKMESIRGKINIELLTVISSRLKKL